jgi:hypothetical protein
MSPQLFYLGPELLKPRRFLLTRLALCVAFFGRAFLIGAYGQVHFFNGLAL